MKHLKLFCLATLLIGGLVSCSDSTHETEELTNPTLATLTRPAGFESTPFFVEFGGARIAVDIQPYFFTDRSFDILVNYDLVSSPSILDEEEYKDSETEQLHISGTYTYDATKGLLTLIHEDYELPEVPEVQGTRKVKAFTVKAKEAETIEFPFTVQENANGDFVVTGNIAEYIKWGLVLDELPTAPSSLLLTKGTVELVDE